MVKCKNCGEQIVIYCASDGGVHILDYPIRGFSEYHYCGDGSYAMLLSKYMMKKLCLKDDQ